MKGEGPAESAKKTFRLPSAFSSGQLVIMVCSGLSLDLDQEKKGTERASSHTSRPFSSSASAEGEEL